MKDQVTEVERETKENDRILKDVSNEKCKIQGEEI